MKRLLLLTTLLLASVVAGAQPFQRTVTFHATDCTAATGFERGTICFEDDASTVWVCKSTDGNCNTAGEWDGPYPGSTSATLAGDVDGDSGANDLDEAAVEAELESVLDLTDLQGDLPLGTKTSGNYAAGDAEAGAALTGDSATAFFSSGQVETARLQPAGANTQVQFNASGVLSADADLVFVSGASALRLGIDPGVPSLHGTYGFAANANTGLRATLDATALLLAVDGSVPMTLAPDGATIVDYLVLGGEAAPADTGVLRLENATAICWESAPEGVDVCMSVDASEILQLTGGAFDGADIDDGTVTANELGVDSVSAPELNATGVEAELEAVLDLAELQGDLALGAQTSGNYVSSATASQGLTLTGTEGASLGLQACAAGEDLQRNNAGNAWACATRVIHNVRAYGAVGDGTTNDTSAIQNAINAAGSGGVVYFPAGNYRIESTLTVGDGSSSAASTTQFMSLVGAGIGSFDSEHLTNAATRISWFGAQDGTMLEVNGPIAGLHMEGLYLDGRGLADYALDLEHPYHSTFRRLQIRNTETAGIFLTAYSSPTGVAIGANHNTFDHIAIYSSEDNATGLMIGETTRGSSPFLDVAGNLFKSVQVQLLGASAVGIALRYTDNLTFVGTSVAATGTGADALLIATVSDATTFPQGISFLHASMIGDVATSGSYTGVRPVVFYDYQTGDGEAVPNTAMVHGTTSEGALFGGWSLPTGAAFPSSPQTGDIFVVTDDSRSGACDSNAGTAPTLCRYNGASWEAPGRGGDTLLGATITASPAASQNDYSPTGWHDGHPNQATTIRLTPSASVQITGVAGGSAGRLLTLVNATAADGSGSRIIILPHESSASAAGNRLHNANQYARFLLPGDSAAYIYDSTSARWRALENGSWTKMFDAFDDGYQSVYTGYFTTGNSGTGSSCQLGTYLNTDTTQRPVGIVQCDTGTTATGRAYWGPGINTGSLFAPGGGAALYLVRLVPEALSNGTERFQVYAGFNDGSAAASPVDGVYWLYDDAISADWRICTEDASAQNCTTVTGFTVSSTVYVTLGIFVYGDWSNADFFHSGDGSTWTLDGQVGSADMPEAADMVSIGAGINKTVGTTQRNISMDWQGIIHLMKRGG